MTECDKFRSYFSNYVDGDLLPDQRKALEDHLSICPPCQRAVKRLKMICQSLKSMPVLTTSPGFEYRLHQQIANLGNGQSIRFSVPIHNWKIPALTSIAVLTVLGIFLILNSSNSPTNVSIPASQSISSPVSPEKISEESASSNENSRQAPNRAVVGMQKDSLRKDSSKDYDEEGMKLVDEK